MAQVGHAKEIFNSAISAAHPALAIASHAGRLVETYRRGGYRRMVAVAFGKAASTMAKALNDEVGELIQSAVVITKHGHVLHRHPAHTKVFEAAHPVPDKNGVEATEYLINLIGSADEQTLIVLLISGGGSALLVQPAHGVSLKDKQLVTQALLNAGADIGELNAVRKHISRVKGGRLAQVAWPARCISFIVSDVIGDQLDIIASGPMVADSSTFADAVNVMRKYNISSPRTVLEYLKEGQRGKHSETPKPGYKALSISENIIVASNAFALEAAKTKAASLGYNATVLTDSLVGEARDAARWLVREIKKHNARPLCLLTGGETTVKVTGNGMGGRNMELALAAAIEIKGAGDITLLAGGTDGTDGPTDAAGAIVDCGTIARARESGLDAVAYLNNNDSYNFFKQTGGLLVTGPTGTNVMDINVALIR